MHIYVYTHTYLYIYTYIYIYICVYVYVYIYMCIYICIWYPCPSPQTKVPPTHACLNPYLRTCVYSPSMYKYIYIYMHLYFLVRLKTSYYRHEHVHELLQETCTKCSSQTNETRAQLPALKKKSFNAARPAEPRPMNHEPRCPGHLVVLMTPGVVMS